MVELNKQELKAKVTKFAYAKQDLLWNLKDRWADEREYEDFQEYVKVAKEAAKEFDLDLVNLSKTFDLKFNALDGAVTLKVRATGMSVAW